MRTENVAFEWHIDLLQRKCSRSSPLNEYTKWERFVRGVNQTKAIFSCNKFLCVCQTSNEVPLSLAP